MAQIPPEVLQDIARRRLGLEQASTQGRQRLLQDYGTNQQRLGSANEQAVQNVNDVLGGQGLFHSGIRVNEQGQVAQNYGQQLADLEQGRSRGLEDISTSLTGGLAALTGEEQRALAEATRMEEQQRLAQELARAQQEALMRAVAPQAPQFYAPPAAIRQPSPEELYTQMFGSQAPSGPGGRSPTSSYTQLEKSQQQRLRGGR